MADRRAALLDLVGPFHGECGVCGGPDARHRVADVIAERVRAGEDPTSVAADYGVAPGDAQLLGEQWWVWTVTSSRGVKRIHVEELTGELIGTGAWRWHRGCRVCCPEIDDVLHPERVA